MTYFNSVIGLLVVVLALIACGLISKRINQGRGIGYILLLAIVYFLFQLQLTTLILGTFGILKPILLFGLNILISASFLRFSANKNNIQELKHKLSTFKLIDFLRSFGVPALFFLTLFLLNAGTIAYRIYILPPSVWDVNTYHLIAPITWYQTETIPLEIESPVDRINYNYLGTKIYNYWTILLAGSLTFVETTQFLFAFLLLYVCYLILRLLNVSKGNSLIFSILAISFPTILIQMRTAHDHMSVLAMTFVLMYLLARLISARRFPVLSELLNIAIASALLVSFKVNGLMYLAVFALSLSIVMRRSLLSIPSLIKNLNINKLTGLATMLILVGCMFVAGYWGFKNYLTGYHPFSQHYESMTNTTGASTITAKADRYLDRLYSNVKVMPERILDLPYGYNPDSYSISSYGITFFTFGIIGYLIVIVLLIMRHSFVINYASNKTIVFILLFSVLSQFLYMSLYFTYFNYRLFTVLPISGVLFFAYFLNNLIKNKSLILTVFALASLTIFYNYFILPTIEDTNAQRFAYSYSKHIPVDNAIYNSRMDIEWNIINLLPDYKRIVYHTYSDGFILPYYDNKLKSTVISLTEFEYEVENGALLLPDETLRVMADRDIQYLHINKRNMDNVTTIQSPYFDHIYGGLYQFKYEKD